MIDNFKKGFWYRFNGETEYPSIGHNGKKTFCSFRKNFMLDGKWHQCSKVYPFNNYHSAAFYDSPKPTEVWRWGDITKPYGEELYMFDELSPAMYNIKKLKELREND